ncbi:hypothetical protein V6x_61260 [Gimesia chilikensis]|uniref:Uncharacterized protein n=1 Tax=Gimesia chilikensis TaxID=2605989 RepID=A0A517WMC8_9PLAN|nr:hypothetical protein V6x_61260 [Gimesia chilikensis]
MFNQEFLESHDIIPAFMPVDLSTSANTGDRVNLKNYERCVFVLLASIGTAGDDSQYLRLLRLCSGWERATSRSTRWGR